jgi:hypothetical protein
LRSTMLLLRGSQCSGGVGRYRVEDVGEVAGGEVGDHPGALVVGQVGEDASGVPGLQRRKDFTLLAGVELLEHVGAVCGVDGSEGQPLPRLRSIPSHRRA